MGIAYFKFALYLGLFSLGLKYLVSQIRIYNENTNKQKSIVIIVLLVVLVITSLYLVIINMPAAVYPHHDYLKQLNSR